MLDGPAMNAQTDTSLVATQCMDRRMGVTTSHKDFEAMIPSMHDVTYYSYPTKPSTIDAGSTFECFLES